ncbi:MAG: YqaJ viral recombinase family protein [Synergistaceae bacterium]|nr:YqaJ viral recombinase family protein [Synergistaceae bacterium]
MTDRTAWLEERRKGIGGSDAAKVLGLSRWGGPLSVYLDKVEGPRDELTSEAAHFGTILEDVVAREFSEREGLKVRRRNGIKASKARPFMLANVDREIVGRNAGLECKTANAFKADEWEGDSLPTEYYAQVQHYCAVMGWEGCWIACLIGGQKFVHKWVPRSERFIVDMIAIEERFWREHVVPRVPPAPCATDQLALPQREELMLPATLADIETAEALAALREEMKALKAREDELTNALKARIGTAAGIEGIATWRQGKASSATDWKAVAEELGAGPELIAKHTATKDGTRRFLLKVKGMAKGEA